MIVRTAISGAKLEIGRDGDDASMSSHLWANNDLHVTARMGQVA